MNAAEHSREQRDAVADGEEAHVEKHVLQAVQKKDHADEKEQVVVPRDHVLRAQVHQRRDRGSFQRLEVQGIAFRDAVGERERRKAEQRDTDRRAENAQTNSTTHSGRLYYARDARR